MYVCMYIYICMYVCIIQIPTYSESKPGKPPTAMPRSAKSSSSLAESGDQHLTGCVSGFRASSTSRVLGSGFWGLFSKVWGLGFGGSGFRV